MNKNLQYNMNISYYINTVSPPIKHQVNANGEMALSSELLLFQINIISFSNHAIQKRQKKKIIVEAMLNEAYLSKEISCL